MNTLNIKSGDTVVVLTGKDSKKQGKVLTVSPKDNKVLVEGVNIITKHQKARSTQEKSEIVKKEAPINASNVMVVCPACNKATRVAHVEIEGKKVRACKHCHMSLDKNKAVDKKVKKDSKKEVVAPKKTTKSKKAEAEKVEKKTTKKSAKA